MFSSCSPDSVASSGASGSEISCTGSVSAALTVSRAGIMPVSIVTDRMIAKNFVRFFSFFHLFDRNAHLRQFIIYILYMYACILSILCDNDPSS